MRILLSRCDSDFNLDLNGLGNCCRGRRVNHSEATKPPRSSQTLWPEVVLKGHSEAIKVLPIARSDAKTSRGGGGPASVPGASAADAGR